MFVNVLKNSSVFIEIIFGIVLLFGGIFYIYNLLEEWVGEEGFVFVLGFVVCG